MPCIHTNLVCKYSCRLRLTWNSHLKFVACCAKLRPRSFHFWVFLGDFWYSAVSSHPRFGVPKYVLEGSCLLPRRAHVQEYFHLGWLTCAQCTSSFTSHSAKKKSTDELILFLLQRAVKRWKWKTGHISKNYIRWKIGHSAKLQIMDFQKCEMSSSPIWKSMCSLACCIFC